MNTVAIDLAATAGLAYLIGSIPFGLILTAAAGLGDIRALGSGNIGATNVLRTGRRGLAAGTLLMDGLKGVVAIWIGRWLLQTAPSLTGLAAAIAAICVILGHCFPVWLGFVGGKGVSTLLGIALALDWRAGLICAALWLALARWTRISSAGGIGAALALPVLLFVFAWPDLGPALWRDPAPWAACLVAAIVVLRHRANIARLLAGTEPRIGQGAARRGSGG